MMDSFRSRYGPLFSSNKWSNIQKLFIMWETDTQGRWVHVRALHNPPSWIKMKQNTSVPGTSQTQQCWLKPIQTSQSYWSEYSGWKCVTHTHKQTHKNSLSWKKKTQNNCLMKLLEQRQIVWAFSVPKSLNKQWQGNRGSIQETSRDLCVCVYVCMFSFALWSEINQLLLIGFFLGQLFLSQSNVYKSLSYVIDSPPAYSECHNGHFFTNLTRKDGGWDK